MHVYVVWSAYILWKWVAKHTHTHTQLYKILYNRSLNRVHGFSFILAFIHPSNILFIYEYADYVCVCVSESVRM